jgi:hypothetical protein
MILGDLAFYAGISGIILYLCLMVIRNTTAVGTLREKEKKCGERAEHLKQKVVALRRKRDKMGPDVDRLLEQMIGLREVRDQLHMQYEEMQEKGRAREIHIKTNIIRDRE